MRSLVIEDDQRLAELIRRGLEEDGYINYLRKKIDKRCSVSVSFSKDQVLLAFKDEGAGIPEDELEHIFEPFFRGKNHQAAGGYGIGLALTQQIIQLHNGRIQANSETNRGTTMRVWLRHL